MVPSLRGPWPPAGEQWGGGVLAPLPQCLSLRVHPQGSNCSPSAHCETRGRLHGPPEELELVHHPPPWCPRSRMARHPPRSLSPCPPRPAGSGAGTLLGACHQWCGQGSFAAPFGAGDCDPVSWGLFCHCLRGSRTELGEGGLPTHTLWLCHACASSCAAPPPSWDPH